MKIGIFIDEPHFRYAGKDYCQFTWHKFAIPLGKSMGQTTLLLPMKYVENKPLFPECCDLDDVEVLEFRPGWESYKEFVQKGAFFFWDLFWHIRGLRSFDLIIIRVPSLAGFFFGEFVRLFHPRVKVVVYVGGNILSATPTISQNGIKQKIMNFLGKTINRTVVRTVTDRLTFTTGTELRDLFQQYTSKIYPVVTGMICENEIFHREDTCQNQEIKLLVVAKLIPMKGIENLIKATSILSSRYNIRLVIAGKGNSEYENQLGKLARDMNLSENISFAGFLSWDDSLREAYKAADIFVLPSLSEGFPRVILEAWAHGLPVVSTNVGGIPSVVRNGKNGILIPPRSVEDIVDGIKTLAENKSLRKQVIAGGYESLTEAYTREKIIYFIKEKIQTHLFEN